MLNYIHKYRHKYSPDITLILEAMRQKIQVLDTIV